MSPTIRITVDGRLAVTVEMAAEIYGYTPAAMRTALVRIGFTGQDWPRLGRMPLYDLIELDAALNARPGRGAPGRPRKKGKR